MKENFDKYNVSADLRYSLFESCKLNNINYGEYIEDVLTRIMKDEEADPSFLPNHYLLRPALKGKEVA